MAVVSFPHIQQCAYPYPDTRSTTNKII